MPPTNYHATIGDVDGDGRNDVEWAKLTDSATEFGVATASGATISARVGFASGGGRSVSIGTLSTGQTVALPTDQHVAYLFVLRGCRWVEPRSEPSKRGTDFVTGYFEPPAAGGGCVGRRLYQVDITQPSKNRYSVTGITEHISSDGRRMTPGREVIFLANQDVNASTGRSRQYGYGRCAPSKVLRPQYRR